MSRYFFLVMATLTLVFFGSTTCLLAQSSTFKEEVQTTVVDAVQASKDFVSGVAAGISEASEGHPDFDPSRVVATKADLARLLKVEIIKVENLNQGHWRLTVALRNNNEAPVKVINLSARGQVIVLDKDGFAYPSFETKLGAQDGVVLPRSALRLRCDFKDLESRPMVFRIYGTDFPVPR